MCIWAINVILCWITNDCRCLPARNVFTRNLQSHNIFNESFLVGNLINSPIRNLDLFLFLYIISLVCFSNLLFCWKIKEEWHLENWNNWLRHLICYFFVVQVYYLDFKIASPRKFKEYSLIPFRNSQLRFDFLSIDSAIDWPEYRVYFEV